MEISTEFLFSIYQKLDANSGSSFNYQKVNRPRYYPEELRYLSQRVDQAENLLEIEKLVNQFNSFVTNRKDDLLRMGKLAEAREKINLRNFFILFDQDNELVENLQGEIVFLAGPLGGGMLQLNEDLTEVRKEQYYQIVEFDAENVGRTIPEVKLNLEFEKFILKSNEELQIGVETFPIQLDDHKIFIERASKYFQDEYQKLSMINDFSPIIDSSFTAVEASIMANTRYFIDLPEVVKQKFAQYKSGTDSNHLNLLGIQNLLDTNQQTPFEIIGYNFWENGQEYSIIKEKFTSNLMIFMVAAINFKKTKKFIDQLKLNKELQYQINSITQRGNQLSALEAKNISSFNPILEELIGSKTIRKDLEAIESSGIIDTVPIGYIRFSNKINGDDPEYFKTSFTKTQLAPSYTKIARDLINSLDVLRSGPLDTLSFNANNISIYLKSGSRIFNIGMRTINEDTRDLVISLVGSYAQIYKDITENELFWENEMVQYIDNLDDAESYEALIEMFPIKQQMSKDQIASYDYDFPLTKFVENTLKDEVVPVLLKRILREVKTFETEHFESGKIEKSKDINSKSDQQQISKLLHSDNSKTYHKELTSLEEEINQFNPGMYAFLTNMMRREDLISGDDTKSLYESLKSTYHDMTIAIIDFGLTPEMWKFADNLQLWNTYQSQINFLKHSIVVALREYLGEEYEGNDINTLANHHFTQRLNYETYHGGSISREYNQLRKIHLSFMPLLNRYRDDLGPSDSLDQIIQLLEKLEEERKNEIRKQLPSLPKR